MKSNSRKNLVTMNKAARLIDNYEQFRLSPGQVNFTPVESYQFPIEAIESYIDYVKSLSSLKGVEVTGLRIVNAIYETDEEGSESQNQQTVLFIPTYRNRKGEDEAFDPLYIVDGKPKNLSKLLRDARRRHVDMPQTGQKVMMSVTEPSESSSFMNFGKMGKPPVHGNE